MAELLEHIENLYAAAETPAAWQPFMQALCGALHASSGAVMALDSAGRPTLFQAHGLSAESAAAYDLHYRKHDVILQRSLRTTVNAPLWVGLRHDLISNKDLEGTEYFQDFMKVYDQFHQMGLTLGHGPAYHFAGITLLRGNAEGAFSTESLQVLRQIGPHLRRSIQLRERLGQAAATETAWHVAAHQTGTGMLLLDRNRRIVRATPAAEALLRAADGIACHNAGLRLDSPADQARFDALLANAASCDVHGSRGTGGAMRVMRSRQAEPVYISVIPAPAGSGGGGKQVCTYVFLTDRLHRLPSRDAALQQVFGLTFAEARLVDLLMQGNDLRSAGERMKVTESSIRFMSKSVFSKMGVTGQRDLLLLVTRLPGEMLMGSHQA